MKKILIPVLAVVALLAVALVAVPVLADDGWQPRCGDTSGYAGCQGRAGDTATCPRLDSTLADGYTCPRWDDTEAACPGNCVNSESCPALEEGTGTTQNQVYGCGPRVDDTTRETRGCGH